MRLRSVIGLATVAVALAASSVASASTAEQSLAPVRPAATVNTTADACGYTAVKPADRFTGIPVFNAAAAAKPYVVRLVTTQGVITFQALTNNAPCTTYSFRFLAQRGYYDRTHCHRLTT